MEGPCAVATSFLTATGNASRLSFLRRDTAPVAVGPWKTIIASSTASFGPAHRRPLERHPRSLRPLGNRLRPLPTLAPRRHVGQRPSTSLLDGLDQQGRLGHELWLVDATVVRASRAAAGAEEHPDEVPRLVGPKPAQVEEPAKHALGYSRGGFGTKVHLLVTDRGIVLGIYVTPGQQHESTAFQPLLRRVLLRRRPGMPYWPTKLAGDKGYSYPHIRSWGGLPPEIWSSGYDSPRQPDPGRERWASGRSRSRSSVCWRRRSETCPGGCRWRTSAASSG